jgi:integrase
MATFRKRGSKWHVQVRRSEKPTQTRSFTHKSDAEAWARKTERQIDNDVVLDDLSKLKGLTVGDLLIRYRNTITPSKRSACVEAYIIGGVLAHQIADCTLQELNSRAIANYRDYRLLKVKSGTVRRDLSILHHCFEIARKEWGIPLNVNPVGQITLPNMSKPRNRRTSPEELDRLMLGCKRGRSPLLAPIILFAIETGMRRGEIVAAKWVDIDFDQSTLLIPITKNDHPRTIPLSPKAIAILRDLPQTDVLVFPISGNAVRLAWERLKKRIGITDLRFHDLRHEAISRFFEMGLSVPEVALISGHRDPRMLFRYTHLRAEDVVKKLK